MSEELDIQRMLKHIMDKSEGDIYKFMWNLENLYLSGFNTFVSNMIIENEIKYPSFEKAEEFYNHCRKEVYSNGLKVKFEQTHESTVKSFLDILNMDKSEGLEIKFDGGRIGISVEK